MGLRDVVDELHHGNGLAYSGAAEEADLSALGERADEVNDLDAGLEDLGRAGLLLVGRSRAVNLPALLLADGAHVVHRLAEDVHDAADGLMADRNLYSGSGSLNFDSAAQSVGNAHGEAAHYAAADLLLNLEDQTVAGVMACYPEGIVYLRNAFLGELDINNRADDLNHHTFGSDACCCFFCSH